MLFLTQVLTRSAGARWLINYPECLSLLGAKNKQLQSYSLVLSYTQNLSNKFLLSQAVKIGHLAPNKAGCLSYFLDI